MFPNDALVESALHLAVLVDAYATVQFPTSPMICCAVPGEVHESVPSDEPSSHWNLIVIAFFEKTSGALVTLTTKPVGLFS